MSRTEGGEGHVIPPNNLLLNVGDMENGGNGTIPAGSLTQPENLSYLFSVWRMGGDMGKAKAM